NTSQGMVTDMEGRFKFEQVETGSYTVTIQFAGYTPRALQAEELNKSVNMEIVAVEEEATTMQELVVVANIAVGEQRSDTTEFSAASFKTTRDASSQDLVEKIPCIEIVDGRIQAQGENVQQILIDGKPFFGTDVSAALQSLPADAVASIQVFDQKSDKAL